MKTRTISNPPDDLSSLSFSTGIMFLREQEALTSPGTPEPPSLPLEAITELRQVFQVRDPSLHEHHLSKLTRALTISVDLDPVDVWRCGQWVFLVDGHHRLEAYRRSERSAIPVKFFRGTVDDALRLAEQRNVKDKLEVTYAERANHAWKLISNEAVIGRLSKRKVMLRTGVSKGTVDAMRRALADLGERASDFDTWHCVAAIKVRFSVNQDETRAGV